MKFNDQLRLIDNKIKQIEGTQDNKATLNKEAQTEINALKLMRDEYKAVHQR